MEDLTHPIRPAAAAADDDDLSLFCCQNPRCVAYGSRGAGNLCVRDRIGKQRHIGLPVTHASRDIYGRMANQYEIHPSPIK